jgi:hypothetical protein
MNGIFQRLCSIVLVLAFLVPSVSRAESDSLTITGKRAKIIGKAAMYGAGGGLVVGLASQVFKKKTKNIFLFGSLGMYAGILLGVYVISTSRSPTPYEGPDTYEDYGDFSLKQKILPESQILAANDPLPSDSVSIQFLHLNF